ncbi:hypothetical protein [Streptomyces bullii]|uniref:Integral-membrane protein n=1 Tax=Streptomyces bullii TaxID=349910 RepID=A0ABW0UYG4_9ACTN
MTAGWCARATRAAVFAAVCVVLAALGHVMMSGDHVPPPTLAVGWAVTGVAGWCLAGRERGLAMIVTVAVAAQTLLHSAFSLTPQASTAAARGTAGGGPGPLDMGSTGPAGATEHHTASLTMTPPAPAPVSTGGGHGMGGHLGHAGDSVPGDSSLGMVAAHLLAALLCGLWLGYGERAAFRLLRAVGGRLTAPLRLPFALPAPPDRPRVRVRRARSDRAPRLVLLVHAITSRGPPAGAAAI